MQSQHDIMFTLKRRDMRLINFHSAIDFQQISSDGFEVKGFSIKMRQVSLVFQNGNTGSSNKLPPGETHIGERTRDARHPQVLQDHLKLSNALTVNQVFKLFPSKIRGTIQNGKGRAFPKATVTKNGFVGRRLNLISIGLQ